MLETMRDTDKYNWDCNIVNTGPPNYYRPDCKLFYKSKKSISKKKRIRTSFTTKQLNILEEKFLKNEYIKKDERILLAERLKLGDRQICTWFQNRRMKKKREFDGYSDNKLEDNSVNYSENNSEINSLIDSYKSQYNNMYSSFNDCLKAEEIREIELLLFQDNQPSTYNSYEQNQQCNLELQYSQPSYYNCLYSNSVEYLESIYQPLY